MCLPIQIVKLALRDIVSEPIVDYMEQISHYFGSIFFNT